VGQVHELHAEDPVRSGFGMNPLALVLGVVGAFVAAVALAALFAHPAGASTPPGKTGAPTIAAVPRNVTQSPVAAVDALTGAVTPHRATPGLNLAAGQSPALGPVAAGSPVATLLQVPGSALHGLAPVIEPISSAIAPPLGPVVTTLAWPPTPAADPALPGAQPVTPSRAEPVTDAPAIRSLGTTAGSAGGPPAFGLRTSSGIPHPAPAPAWPFQSFPLVTNSSPTADSSLSSAGTSLAAAPASGPLLPDQPVSVVIPAEGGLPRFLFDLRSSPPG